MHFRTAEVIVAQLPGHRPKLGPEMYGDIDTTAVGML
jgi:hypothetical protein